jgi:hypothetical protein
LRLGKPAARRRWIHRERLPPPAVLTAIGAGSRGAPYFIRVLTHRRSLNQAMPDFASLGKKRVRELAIFLQASKGIR